MDYAHLEPTSDPNSPDQAVPAPIIEAMDDIINTDEQQPEEPVPTTEEEELYHSADEEERLPKAGSSGHAGYSEEHSPGDSDTRIRRSTRDIKRPKFDDELVDSGVGFRSHTRRLSERSSSSFSASDDPRPPPIPSTVALSIDTSLASVLNTASVSAEPSPMTPYDDSPAAWAIGKGEMHSSDGSSSAAKRHDLRERTHMISLKDRMAMDDAIQEEEAARMERKRRESRIASKDIRVKEIAAAHEAAEALSLELDDWTAEDDIALVTAITHIGDVEAVHRGCRFSRDYSTEEMEERWYQLMYDESLSRQAKKRMQELHPELILKIQSKTPFSVTEEEILREIEASQNPCLELMCELIKDHPEEFHSARTPQILLDHWHMMLRHQVLAKAPPTSIPAHFERVERNSALCGANPMKAANDLRLLNNRLAKVGVQPVAGIVTDAQLGPGAVATLIGKVVRFVLRREHMPVLLGRNTSEISADVNLSLEGPSAKISRKQAQITMEANGELWMRNLSPASCIVDGKKLDEGQKTRLNNNTMIEFGIIKLTFRLVNNPSTIPKAQV